MAEMIIDKKHVVPVRNIPSYHGNDIIEILNNEDLSNALDGKVDKVSTPSVFYGTDSVGNQTTYDVSSLFSTEVAPEGYTNVEYITGTGGEDNAEIQIITGLSLQVSYKRLAVIQDMFTTFSSRLGFTVVKIKFVCVDYNSYKVWKISGIGANGEEDVAYERESTSGLHNMYAIDVSGEELGDEFYIVNLEGKHQYIDTGITINNYPNGHATLDTENSSYENPELKPSWSPTYSYATKSRMNAMEAYYSGGVRGFKFVYSATDTLDLYPVGREASTPYTTYNDATSTLSDCGIYFNWSNFTVGDEIYFNYTGSEYDNWGMETSFRLLNSELASTKTRNYIAGSVSQSSNFGCGISCGYNDGIVFRHYIVNYTGLDTKYVQGDWNNVTVTPGQLTVNTNVTTFSTSGDIRTVPEQHFILFGQSREDGIYDSGVSMKKTRIYKNNTLVFDGVPCIENSTGIAGMYDLVSKQFFKSAIEGNEFVAGPVISGVGEVTLGVKGNDVVLGLNSSGALTAFSGTNGIIIESGFTHPDYEELEYIESTDGNLAFDTQRKWGNEYAGYTGSTSWEITYYQTQQTTSSTIQYVFGDGYFADMGQPFSRIDFRFFDSKASFYYTSDTGNTHVDDLFMESLNQWHTFSFNQAKLFLDGKTVRSLYPTISINAHNKNFYIFSAPNAIQGAGYFAPGFIGRISKVVERISPSRTFVYSEFIPVRRKSDGELGFYDKINGVFCPNINPNGTPIAGPIKSATISLSKNLDNVLENQAGDSAISLRNMIVSDTNLSDSYSDLSKQHNTVLGINAHSKGDYNTIIGSDAGATEDKNSNTVIGNGAYSYASNNVAIGDTARANMNYSIAVGSGASARQMNSIAIGYNTQSVGNYGIAIGVTGGPDPAYYAGNESVLIGYLARGAQATGMTLIGARIFTNAGPTYSVGIGHSAQLIGGYNVGIGYGATPHNESVAIGSKTYVGEGGIAIGSKNGSDSGAGARAGNYSVAIGQTSKILSNYSVALGYGAHDTSNALNYSVGIGYNAMINSSWSVALGHESKVEGAYSIAIGNEAHVMNSSVVTGDPGLNSIAIGSESSVDKSNAIALGYQTSASGYNIAIGQYANANGNNEVAIGSWASTSGSGGIAIGESTGATNRSVAVGNSANASNARQSVAIGPSTVVSAENSVALGVNAQISSNASNAIQLGAGTNSNSYSLQFRNYPLVDSDGIIPYDRLSLDAPTNGYVLAYDEANDSLTWIENGEGGGSYVLPIASASTLGGIKVGTGLSINSETGVLSVTGGTGGGDGVWGQITGNLEDQGDLMQILNSKFEQTSEMPKASNVYNNKVYQFIGITDLLYKHGYVYECQYRKVSSLTGYTSDDSRFTVTFDARRFEEYFKEYHPEIDLTNERNYSILFDGAVNKWNFFIDGTTPGIGFDTYNLQHVGIYLNYVGQNEPETDDEVTMEYIPSTDQESPFGYVWNQLNVQDNATVVDNVTSTSRTDALSANQGRVLQEKINTLESIGQFLAIWDCNKNGHNARYLDDGYQYQRGNYFIIGAVEEWNLDPEEGPVTVSFDTNNQVAISAGYTTYGDETKTYNRYKPTTDATFKFTWDVSSQKWYDETKHTYLDAGSLVSTIGFGPSYPATAREVQAADLVEGDYFEVLYTHTHNYFPVGDTYYEAPNAGCVRTYEDVQVSDMIFYDGANWVLLANHSKQTAVDHDLDSTSKNPVENATVTNALNNKVSTTSNGNRVYGTTSLGEQIALELGDGFTNENGVLSVDISGKQDTLVSGENIKTINGESILGSGDLIIQGGGGEGMGTLNISNVFHRYHSVTKEEDVRDDRDDNYKGGYKEILFTTNADIDYLKANKEDIYVTYSRRNAFHNLRKYRVLNDHRVKSDVKLYCWRYKTYQYWDSTFNTMRYNDSDWDNYSSDLNYEYFYTLSDYSDDVETMYSDNPAMFISDLRRQGAQKDEDNYSMGNWGTCFNELYNYDTVQNYYDDYSEAIENGRLERCAKYDIDELVIDTQDLKYDGDEDTDFIIKMVGQSFTKNGLKYYFWSHEWWNEGSIYACLDDNDNPIPNYVPEDKSKIVYFCEFADLESEGYELVEKRPDLVWWKFNENRTTNNISRFIEHCREITTNCSNDNQTFNNWTNDESVTDFSCNDQWSFMERISNKDGDYTLTYDASAGGWYFNYDGNLYYPNDLGDNSFELLDGEFSYRVNTDAGYSSVEDGAVLNIYFENRYDKAHRVYFWDYPIQPVRLSQCKIVMTSMPPFQPKDPETDVYPTDKYEDYMFHAYTFDEIDASEDLTYMLQCQKEIIFVYPYDTHHLWMRTFGFTKMVYQHARTDVRQYQWHWEDDNPTWDYDSETGDKIPVDYTMYAEPWDRHNLRRGMFLGGQRNLGNTDMAEDTQGMGDFDNRMGPIQGTENEPRWTMGLQALYFLPVALNINKANEVFYNTDGKSTPFYFKLCITGMSNQKILAGQ